jgi:ankyrin repeat protein
MFETMMDDQVDALRTSLQAASWLDVNERVDHRGFTLLQFAVFCNARRCVTELLARGAHPDTPGFGGSTPLQTAIGILPTEDCEALEVLRLDSCDLVKVLLDAGAVADGTGRDCPLRPLFAAVVLGHADAVRWLIAAGADVNAVHAHTWPRLHLSGMRPLHAAIFYDRAPLVALLLESGANSDADAENRWLRESPK